MRDSNTYLYRAMPNTNFCVDVFLKNDIKRGENYKRHWHEQLQLYYFVEGKAILECGHNRFEVSCGNVAVVNSNELHYLESLSDDLEFYVIRIDPTFLFSNQVDLLQTKYFAPLAQNHIAFQNLIENDAQIVDYVTKTIQEYFTKETGYELAIKGSIYQLIVLLMRRYVGKILTKNEFEERARTLKRYEDVFQAIENNYVEKISLKELADSVNISTYHFCRTFKQMTGKTTTEYINGVRLEKAVCFLEQTNLNITEIAQKCGFDSVNYFSRLFRKHYNTSATKFRRTHTGQFST
ncbi:AraC family transcriptional regulator [Sporolactobacillus pectinivorans]|uniref:AraC family transcriptional regulator n=1 Tax=Sporolactobacillus pectinivorans TaxID=1591408 RepID=UPI000C261F8C|nr:AraC family transcriptional regulator [Sporolactobacillus pectinivorans]